MMEPDISRLCTCHRWGQHLVVEGTKEQLLGYRLILTHRWSKKRCGVDSDVLCHSTTDLEGDLALSAFTIKNQRKALIRTDTEEISSQLVSAKVRTSWWSVQLEVTTIRSPAKPFLPCVPCWTWLLLWVGKEVSGGRYMYHLTLLFDGAHLMLDSILYQPGFSFEPPCSHLHL